MTNEEAKREKTFSEELPYFKERMKEISDNYDNPDGYADVLYLSALSDSYRIVRKAEEEINRQQAEIERLKCEMGKLLPKDCSCAVQMEISNNLEKRIKAEAVKEFWNRLKAQNTMDERIISVKSGDDLVKEMTGDK